MMAMRAVGLGPTLGGAVLIAGRVAVCAARCGRAVRPRICVIGAGAARSGRVFGAMAELGCVAPRVGRCRRALGVGGKDHLLQSRRLH